MNIKQVATVSIGFDSAKLAMDWARKQTQFARHGAKLYVMKVKDRFFVVRSITKRDHEEPRLIIKANQNPVTYIEYVNTLIGKPIPWLYTVTNEPLYLVK